MLFQNIAVSISAMVLVISLASAQIIADLRGDTVDTPTSTPVALQTLSGTDVAADVWMYPDAAGAQAVLKRSTNIHTLKAEFLHINDDGAVEQINQSVSMPNGYSQTLVDLIKAHSAEQYVTVSGSLDGTSLAMQDPQTITNIAAFADKAGFNIELDWEDYGQWSPEYYQNYKQFVKTLATKLHARGHKLMIDGPPIYDSTSQAWYKWNYAQLNPLVDEIVMMIYDNQFDTGVGNSIAPQEWSQQCMQWLYAATAGHGIAGVAAYGYTGTQDRGRITVNTSDYIHLRAGTAQFTRNRDGEMTAQVGTIFYDYSDAGTLKTRLSQVQASGLKRLSVWSLGNNPWF